jgi:ESCRT-II complex subunit VPS25
MINKDLAVYEPAKQTRAALLYWRLPEEWADVLYEWVTNTGQLNTILTFYEISDPPVPSALSGIPESLLRGAIAVLAKSGRAQQISISDGDGVRFFPPRSTK